MNRSKDACDSSSRRHSPKFRRWVSKSSGSTSSSISRATPAARPALGDAYRVEARIVVWHADAVLKVPGSALFRHEEQWSVFEVVDGLARLRPVEIGHRNDLEAEILSGLPENAVVILHPSDRIFDGTRVEAR